MRNLFLALLALLGLTSAPALHETQQRGTPGAASEATTRIVTAARGVLTSLDDAGRAKVQFAFDDAAQRTRWSNLPTGIFPRQGLRLGDLTAAQRAAVMTLLEAALSANGYRKVNEIMRG